jgi:hypothetical protein
MTDMKANSRFEAIRHALYSRQTNVGGCRGLIEQYYRDHPYLSEELPEKEIRLKDITDEAWLAKLKHFHNARSTVSLIISKIKVFGELVEHFADISGSNLRGFAADAADNKELISSIRALELELFDVFKEFTAFKRLIASYVIDLIAAGLRQSDRKTPVVSDQKVEPDFMIRLTTSFKKLADQAVSSVKLLQLASVDICADMTSLERILFQLLFIFANRYQRNKA